MLWEDREGIVKDSTCFPRALSPLRWYSRQQTGDVVDSTLRVRAEQTLPTFGTFSLASANTTLTLSVVASL